MALKKTPADVCDAQVVGYVCARSVAANLLTGGTREFRRLNRFWEAPVRAADVLPMALPGRRDLAALD
jgi:hypothetical protein